MTDRQEGRKHSRDIKHWPNEFVYARMNKELQSAAEAGYAVTDSGFS